MLIAQAIFLLQRRQTDRPTDVTERPTHVSGYACVGKYELLLLTQLYCQCHYITKHRSGLSNIRQQCMPVQQCETGQDLCRQFLIPQQFLVCCDFFRETSHSLLTQTLQRQESWEIPESPDFSCWRSASPSSVRRHEATTVSCRSTAAGKTVDFCSPWSTLQRHNVHGQCSNNNSRESIILWMKVTASGLEGETEIIIIIIINKNVLI